MDTKLSFWTGLSISAPSPTGGLNFCSRLPLQQSNGYTYFNMITGGAVDYGSADCKLFVGDEDISGESALQQVYDAMPDAKDYAALTYLADKTERVIVGKQRVNERTRQVLVLPLYLFLRTTAIDIPHFDMVPWQTMLIDKEELLRGMHGFRDLGYHEYMSKRDKFFSMFKTDEEFIHRYMVVHEGKRLNLKIGSGICQSCPRVAEKTFERCGPCMYNCQKSREILKDAGLWENEFKKDGHIVNNEAEFMRTESVSEFVVDESIPFITARNAIYRLDFGTYLANNAYINPEARVVIAATTNSNTSRNASTIRFKKNVCTGCIVGQPKNLCRRSKHGGENCAGPFAEDDIKSYLDKFDPQLLQIVSNSGKRFRLNSGKEIDSLTESILVRPTSSPDSVIIRKTTLPFMASEVAWSDIEPLIGETIFSKPHETYESLPTITKVALVKLVQGELDFSPELNHCTLRHNVTDSSVLMSVEIDEDGYIVATYNNAAMVLELRFTNMLNFNLQWHGSSPTLDYSDQREMLRRIYRKLSLEGFDTGSFDKAIKDIKTIAVAAGLNAESTREDVEALYRSHLQTNCAAKGKSGRARKKNSVRKS